MLCCGKSSCEAHYISVTERSCVPSQQAVFLVIIANYSYILWGDFVVLVFSLRGYYPDLKGLCLRLFSNIIPCGDYALDYLPTLPGSDN